MPFNLAVDFDKFRFKRARLAAEAGAQRFVHRNLVQIHMPLFNGFFCLDVTDIMAVNPDDRHAGDAVFEQRDRGRAGFFPEIHVIR